MYWACSTTSRRAATSLSMTPRSRSHTYKLYSCWKNNRWPTGRLSEGRTSLPPLWSQRDQPTGQHRTMLNCHLSQATGSPTRTWELSLASCQQATTKVSSWFSKFRLIFKAIFQWYRRKRTVSKTRSISILYLQLNTNKFWIMNLFFLICWYISVN